MQTVLVILAIPFGLLAGGFATMLADRMLDDSSLSLGSRCPHCGVSLSAADTMPVLSWFRLGGACRHCGDKITVGYPIVEVATALLFVWVAFRYDQTDWLIIVPLILVVAGVALAATDLYTYRLPNRIVFPAFWASLIAMVVLALVELDDISIVLTAVVVGLAYFLLLFVIAFVYPPAMGFGDVKLALLLGLHVGWVASAYFGTTRAAVQLLFWAVVIGHVAHLVLGVPVILLRRRGIDPLPDPEAGPDDEDKPARRRALPMGPSLILGALFVVLYPATLLS